MHLLIREHAHIFLKSIIFPPDGPSFKPRLGYVCGGGREGGLQLISDTLNVLALPHVIQFVNEVA